MKRNAAALLWFLAVWTAAAVLVTFVGLPAPVVPVAASLAGALVWLDPGGWLWKAQSDAAIRRRRLADLPRVSETPRQAEAQRESGTVES
jgi:hypothetical protein